MAEGFNGQKDLARAQRIFEKPHLIKNEVVLRDFFLSADSRQVWILVRLLELKANKPGFVIQFNDYDLSIAMGGWATVLPEKIRRFLRNENLEPTPEENRLIWDMISKVKDSVVLFEEVRHLSEQ